MNRLLVLASAAAAFFACASPATAAPALLHRLTWDEYVGTLTHWRQQHPGLVSLEARGVSGQNMPVYLLKITDAAVPAVDKQVCLVTALHSGPERTGATGALALAEWLLGDDPLAVETRRRQVVLIMPVINPLAMFYTDRFRNEHGVDPYTGTGRIGKVLDAKTLKLARPEEAPELAAVLAVIDDHQPEIHADLHGTGLQEYGPDQFGARRMYRGQIMTEVTGGAYSNFALRPWDWRVTEAMVAAGQAAGFPSDRFEADAQRTLWGPDMAALGGRLWHGMPLFYTAHYGYAKYHTMVLTQEVAWEESVVARMQGLLRIGNSRWGDEHAPGYPVNRMRHFVGHYVTATGRDASQRRASRVELWNRQAGFSLGFLYPQTEGRESLVVATTAAAKKLLAVDDLAALRANLRATFGGKAAGMERFITDGPEIKLGMEHAKPQLLAATAPEGGEAPLAHGIGFRLRLPCRDPKGLTVQLNGEAHAFDSWYADGFTQVQVDVSAERARGTELFFITCAYQPVEKRAAAWMPPKEVQAKQATAKLDATPPTVTDLPYGDHFRQTLDVWLAQSAKPAPLVFYIHGGGYAAHDKTDIHQHLDVAGLLKAGVSVASINYRFLVDADAAQVDPPVQWPLRDAARALQLVRSKVGEWNIDPARIAATGVSAGGCSALWLAMHDDMAEPQSADAVARESTRVLFTVTKAPQPSLDPRQMVEWVPNSIYSGHLFGYKQKSRPDSFAPFLANRDKHAADIRRYSPMAHATADDPPAYMLGKADKPPVKGEPQTDPSHSVLLCMMLEHTLRPLGVVCTVHHPLDGRPQPDMQDLLLQHLLTPSTTPSSKP